MEQISVHADITVIGGGLAGVAAAIGAAREGARVSLVNNRPVLGGNASSEIRVWVCGATAHGAQKYARETGVMGELFRENQYRNPEGNPFLWDQVVLDAVRAESNIRLYLNTDVRKVAATGDDDDRVIRSVTGWQMDTERELAFTSSLFIDATGDGLVGDLAGARYRTGREAHAEFEEEWAPEAPDDDMLGSTMFFYTKDAGEPVRFVPPSVTKDIAATTIVRNRPISTTANGCDYWWIEYGGELDSVRDAEFIRDELWGVIYGIWDHIKNSGEFDADTLTLEWVGSVPGKREYRRFEGDVVLTQHDIMNQTRFEDSIGFGGWSIDLHPPGGMYSDDHGSKHLFTAGIYHIPFRSLYSRNVSNMLMAGRDISASHVAFGTTRVMATCAVTGEAAGVAAAICARESISPRTLATERLEQLQQTLLRRDASMLGVPWRDASDLALAATATASSTIQRLTTDAAGPAVDRQRFPFDEHDLAILFPVQPSFDGVDVLLDLEAPAELDVELWSTGGGENHIPVRLLDATTVAVEAGSHWAELPFTHLAPGGENAVVVFRRHPHAALVVENRPAPYGVLGLVSRTPRTSRGQAQSNAWSAEELRRRSPLLRVHGATTAYAAAQAVGGLQRPYDGPRLWSSERTTVDPSPWLQLRWPDAVEIRSVELVFNDDVDIDLVNLHHHRTPWPVMPELVRDYRIEARVDDAWVTVAEGSDNRTRLRTHTLDASIITDAIRLVVEATNGSEWASVVGIRAFG
ncbi:FAD-dependent oxidoreductase [Agromyces aureus]|uniref:Pyridine nucleotide-disulfide oxidoreductase n=1 Tax=Agromyces aureus TaxID=453304 RepID=A0A191WIY5_9MICO|nr:FAD-dependent oxidoreductase [Agromyces aureus]ANJ28138.1 pyridine nucleotide-disulfide oxidoreductase [Agromyces aureus]